jgi:peptide/nickel transport system substrate-binding protein
VDKQRQLDDFFGISSPEEGPENKPKKHMGLKDVIDRNNKSIKARLRLLPKILSQKERYLIFAFLVAIAGGLISIPIISYYHYTKPIAANGGTMTEGIVGEPRHINPLIPQTDADRDLIRLIYSGLFKYNEEGKLVPDLAKSYEISPDELNYTVYLKENAEWHDDEPVTADDIIFTVETAQNTDYGSLQRINWQGVELEKANDRTVIFKLKNKYAQFLNNLTLPIIPKHLWENIQPINFALSDLNLKPIGSGPFKFKKLQKDKSGKIVLYELSAFQNFYDGRPFVDTVRVKFYESEDGLIEAYNNNEMDNIGLISPNNLKKIKFRQRLNVQSIRMPRYFGVFFNQNQSKVLSDKNVRLALAYATDREALIGKILEGQGEIANSPMVGTIFDMNDEVKKYEYNKDLAAENLKKAGWEATDENGVLVKNTGKKDEEKLTIKLTTSTWPELTQVANQLKEQWKLVGIDLEVDILPTSELQQSIKERNYQMLLFGEILNLDPDPFSLWHSSQKRDPGLNLALYDNTAADTILEDARKTLNPEERIKKYNDFQKLVTEDVPALFLYSPYYLYGQSKKINGFGNKTISTPSDRFFNIQGWFIDTKRIWR